MGYFAVSTDLHPFAGSLKLRLTNSAVSVVAFNDICRYCNTINLACQRFFIKLRLFFVKNTAFRHKQAVAFQPLNAVVYMKFTALKSIPTVFIAL